jgi:biotin transport system substrate-specific component
MKSISAVLNKEIAVSGTTKSILMVLFFSFVMFASSLIRIYTPFSPVPFTLQTFALFMAVYYLNLKELGISQAIYILAGIIGAPVFAAGLTGAMALVGPTAGYLAGFIAAGIVMSLMKPSMEKYGFAGMAAVFSAGMAIIYLMGAAHLAFVYGMGIKGAVAAGIIPFIAADAVKIAAAASLRKAVRK